MQIHTRICLCFLKETVEFSIELETRPAGSCEMSVGRRAPTQMTASGFLVMTVTEWPSGRNKAWSSDRSRVLGCGAVSETNINHRKLTGSSSFLRLHV